MDIKLQTVKQMWEEIIFEIFNISENNIISVRSGQGTRGIVLSV
jgi:hypothetical protein